MLSDGGGTVALPAWVLQDLTDLTLSWQGQTDK